MPTDFVSADNGPADANTDPRQVYVRDLLLTAMSTLILTQQIDSATSDKSLQESALNTADDSKPYTKVDYKKRYDDLKKYYDRKLGDWNTKEGDLKAQLQANRPKYTPPKSEEELKVFKERIP